MAARNRFWLGACVLWELVRYDLLFAWRGLPAARQLPSNPSAPGEARNGAETAIAHAVRSAAPFYWKPVRCLQRSIVTARLMRHRGVSAQVVIGYRPAPFFSHAWVEVGGRVVNESQSYQKTMRVLERL